MEPAECKHKYLFIVCSLFKKNGRGLNLVHYIHTLLQVPLSGGGGERVKGKIESKVFLSPTYRFVPSNGNKCNESLFNSSGLSPDEELLILKGGITVLSEPLL